MSERSREAERRAAARREAERREAERRAKREAINRKISEKNRELSTVTGQIDGLTAQNGTLNDCMSEWSQKKSAYNGNPTVSEVVIANVFEGRCAEAIKTELSEAVSEMDLTYSNVGSLKGEVNTQIARLKEKASSLNSEISSLRAELARI